MISKTTAVGRFVLCLLMVAVFAWASPTPSHTVTIQGYVLDSACAFTKGLEKPISEGCAVACAKAGSPLVILTADGVIYLPVSDATPAASQNDRLLPFAGKKVVASGKVYERKGAHALVIEKIEAAAEGK